MTRVLEIIVPPHIKNACLSTTLKIAAMNGQSPRDKEFPPLFTSETPQEFSFAQRFARLKFSELSVAAMTKIKTTKEIKSFKSFEIILTSFRARRDLITELWSIYDKNGFKFYTLVPSIHASNR